MGRTNHLNDKTGKPYSRCIGRTAKLLAIDTCPKCGEPGRLKIIRHYSKKTGKLMCEFEICQHFSYFDIDGVRKWGRKCYLGLTSEPKYNKLDPVNYLKEAQP
jgi:hypothetical protein